jgi:hypothetical protein
LAEGIRLAYPGLFETFHDAHMKDNEALRNYFSTKTTAGERVISAMVATFKTLVSMADFSEGGDRSSPTTAPTPPSRHEGGSGEKGLQTDQRITINVNVELVLPATKDKEIYDGLFQSLKKNILSKGAND